ncbi:ribonuclease III [Kaistia dalseonensis]|uniref:Ribonuclease 3 n=1 Tax=Kaistia dalseonensis TaxID=410840 RepID=A0ABU0H3P5_9HYPH|nr:ribonuclease III [Kaistia dalseonensis]MCX5493579.1 ribonuclease III [Kaistia dalseonensis]MDQ0436139.1 ribonuclease-3 [Kaistia dalseonensis]
MTDALQPLEDRLGHKFKTRGHLVRALTHASAVAEDHLTPSESYQRLEFLGDRVLALVIADMLIDAFPNAEEGELARRLTGLVRNESCAEVAVEIGLGNWIRLGGGEVQSGGRRKAAILGDVCEAVIGALFVDGGLPVAQRFIEDNWRKRMLNWTGPLRDAKTTLQEWVQGRGLSTPKYEIVERSGPDHAPHFVVEVRVEGMMSVTGTGRSKREAEQKAASAVLLAEGVWRQETHAD